MTRRPARWVPPMGVLVLAGVIVAGPALLPDLRRVPVSAAAPLPVPASTPALACPGPESLTVPEGGTPVTPPAPVLISSVAATTPSAAAAVVEAGPGADAGADADAGAGGSASGDGPATARLDLLGDDSSRAGTAAGRADRRSPAPEVTTGRHLRLSPPAGYVGSTGSSGSTGTPAAGGSGIAGPGEPVVLAGSLAATALGPAVLWATPAAGAPHLAAVQSTLSRSGDLRSLAAVTCGPGSADSWLVGGSTQAGERLRLLLTNGARTPAVVDVEVRGPDGPVPAASGEGVTVAAGSVVPVYVDALAPGLERVVVHVTARTGRVTATLHDWRMNGLQPGGADDVAPAAPPSRQQLVPGVSLIDGFGRTAGDLSAPGSTWVRVAVPGGEDAVVRVRLLDSSGVVELPKQAVATIRAGSVADIPLARVPAGTYTAVVDSDVPVVAGARIGRRPVAREAPAAEFAWAASARPLVGGGYVAVPPGVHSTLSLVAAGPAGRLRVTPVDAAGAFGDAGQVAVPGGTSATVQVAAGAVAIRIDGIDGGPVAANLVSWISDRRGSLISVPAVDLPARPAKPGVAVHDPDLGLR